MIQSTIDYKEKVMSKFVASVLGRESVEEETFGPLEELQVRQEGLELTHETGLAIDRYDAILESAQSLEAMVTLAEENPQSLESLSVPFEVASSGHLKDDLSLEGISSFLKKVWDAIVSAWNKLKEMVMKLIDWITGRGGKSQKDKLADAEKDLKRVERLEATFDQSWMGHQDSLNGFTKLLAEREKQYHDATKNARKKTDFLDDIPTANQEDFNKYMLESDDDESVTVDAKEYAKQTAEVVDATIDTAKQYEKTVKARDELQATIDKKLKDVPEEDQSAMAAAMRKLQSGPESHAAKALNTAVKQTTKATNKVVAITKTKQG